MDTIKFKRGSVTNLSNAGTILGEPKFTTDEKGFYIGDGSSNVMLGVGMKFITKAEFDALSDSVKNNGTLYWIQGVESVPTVEYFPLTTAFQQASGACVNLSTASASKYDVTVFNGSLCICNIYFDSSIKQTSTGWKRVIDWNPNWKYQYDPNHGSASDPQYRCGGSMYANNSYVNMAFETSISNGVRTYYYSGLTNQTGGVNMSLAFSVTLRSGKSHPVDNTKGVLYRNGVFYNM